MQTLQDNLLIAQSVLQDLNKVSPDNHVQLNILNCRLESVSLEFQPKSLRMENFQSHYLTKNELKYRAEGIVGDIIDKIIEMIKSLFGMGSGGGGGGGTKGNTSVSAQIEKIVKKSSDVSSSVQDMEKKILADINEKINYLLSANDGVVEEEKCSIDLSIWRDWLLSKRRYEAAIADITKWFDQILDAAGGEGPINPALNSYMPSASGTILITYPTGPLEEVYVIKAKDSDGFDFDIRQSSTNIKKSWYINKQVSKELQVAAKAIEQILNVDEDQTFAGRAEKKMKQLDSFPDKVERAQLALKAAKLVEKINNDIAKGFSNLLDWFVNLLTTMVNTNKRIKDR